MILTPFQKLPNNVGDLGKIIVATAFEWLHKEQKIAKSGHTAGQSRNARTAAVQTKIPFYVIDEKFFSKNGPFSASFSIQLTVGKQLNVRNKGLPMTGFKPRTSGVGSDCSTN